MPRPSRNVDAALLRAGLALYPAAGVRGLSVRKVAERAGVNVAMFHYHFGSKENFVRVLLDAMYERMFERLTLAVSREGVPPEAALREALLVLVAFLRDHRAALLRILLDALAGERVAIEFARANLPRHVGVVMRLVTAAQAGGTLRPVAPAQVVAFMAGALGAPILLGSALFEQAQAKAALRRAFERDVLGEAALAQRVDLVLAALAEPAPPARALATARPSRRAAAGADEPRARPSRKSAGRTP